VAGAPRARRRSSRLRERQYPYLLLRTLREVMAGGTFLTPEIAGRRAAEGSAAINPLDGLSPREATRASYKTVANSCALMKRKLGARASFDLARVAMEQKLL
jgi:two-component system invasion response regulator UvrY